jgi:prophage tail gpP-like protein
MPKIEELAALVVNGRAFRDWSAVAVEVRHGDPIAQATFSVAEVGANSGGWAAQRLALDQQASVTLAGRVGLKGIIAVRQAAFNAQQHGLQIIVQSDASKIVISSAQVPTGQFKGYTYSAIAKSLLAPHGLSFEMRGSPAGAEKVFDKVNVLVGESPWHVLERLARMRNLFLMPKADGTGIIAHRGGEGGAVAELVEGKNIKAAQCVLRDDAAFNKISVIGQKKGNDQEWGDDARVSATAVNPQVSGNRPLIIIAEEPIDRQDAQMRADRDMAENVATSVNANITVQGWLTGDGRLWMELLGEDVTVKSPMLFPENSMTLAISAVRHTQDDGGGTETSLTLCLRAALGGPIGIGGPGGGGSPAQPDPVET